tara:strand:+ start:30341 stop:30574 length:234 start_codon:yes stop_codon:yes gene_type:complete
MLILKLIKTINTILQNIATIKTERNSFIHGIWSEPENQENDIHIICSNPKMKFTKEDNGRRWTFGKGKHLLNHLRIK